jgi:hypothetical protein
MLKNLMLPGIGHFIILDLSIVTGEETISSSML